MQYQSKIISFLIVFILFTIQSSYAKPLNNRKRPVPFQIKKFSKPAPMPQKKLRPVPIVPESRSLDNKEDIGLTVGLKAGSAAGLTGAMGDIMYSLSNIVPGASIRGSVGYLTGSNKQIDERIKIATVNLDGIYSLDILKNPEIPFNMYVGGGLIYPWKVNRNASGGWGAHAYLGGKYLIENNSSLYGELAYSGIKYNREQAALRGIEAMLGYSYSF